MRVTSGQHGGALCRDDGNGGYVGEPSCVEGESERLGHVSDLKQGGKAKWVGRPVLKLNFELKLFPKMTLNVTLGKSSGHRHSRTVFCGPRARGAPESAHHRLGLPTPQSELLRTWRRTRCYASSQVFANVCVEGCKLSSQKENAKHTSRTSDEVSA